MRALVAIIALATLTGCANFAELQEQGREIRMRGSMGTRTTTIHTPQATYLVQSRTQGTATRIDVRTIR